MLNILYSSQGQISLGRGSLGAPSLRFSYLTQNTMYLFFTSRSKMQENRLSQSSECCELVHKVVVFSQLWLSPNKKIFKSSLACFKHSAVHLFLIYMYCPFLRHGQGSDRWLCGYISSQCNWSRELGWTSYSWLYSTLQQSAYGPWPWKGHECQVTSTIRIWNSRYWFVI